MPINWINGMTIMTTEWHDELMHGQLIAFARVLDKLSILTVLIKILHNTKLYHNYPYDEFFYLPF